jgi:hypothetical protein
MTFIRILDITTKWYIDQNYLSLASIETCYISLFLPVLKVSLSITILSSARFEVLMAVTMKIALMYDVTSEAYSLVDRYRRFGGMCYFLLQCRRNTYYLLREGIMFLRKVDKDMPEVTASHQIVNSFRLMF